MIQMICFFPLNVTGKVWTVARKTSLLKELWNMLLKLYFIHSFLTVFLANIKLTLCCLHLRFFVFVCLFPVWFDEKSSSSFNLFLHQFMIHPLASVGPKCRSEQATLCLKGNFFESHTNCYLIELMSNLPLQILSFYVTHILFSQHGYLCSK